jgi:hypothetical protein
MRHDEMVDLSGLPSQWREAFARDAVERPPLPDPLPERRLARLLAAFVMTGLFFLVAPGTLLGVWNLVGISSQQQMAAISAAWIQAHGHAQFFGWVGTFIIGISLYTLPKFRGAVSRSMPVGWAMWALWISGVALRWWAGIMSRVHPAAFRVSAVFELAVALMLIWQVTVSGASHRKGQAWELPVFSGFGVLVAILAWQLVLVMQPLEAPELPLGADRTLISLAIWTFAFPVVLGYSAKLFPGLMGALPASSMGMRGTIGLAAVGGAGFLIDSTILAASATAAAVTLGWWSLRVFHSRVGKPKITGVYGRYPRFVRIAYVWLGVAALLGFGAAQPGMLGASRHAFTVGFLATLIFSIGPRILPSFLNSRELWSTRLMGWSLALITAGCTLRVISEPLAYGGFVSAAWSVLPLSSFLELTAVLLFAYNLAMSLATPVPAWFGRKQVNDRMTIYWLISSYPATRSLLIENGLRTLAGKQGVPKSLSLREAAAADGVPAETLVNKLGDFFEARLPRSLRKQ